MNKFKIYFVACLVAARVNPPEFRVTGYIRKWPGIFFHFHYGKFQNSGLTPERLFIRKPEISRTLFRNFRRSRNIIPENSGTRFRNNVYNFRIKMSIYWVEITNITQIFGLVWWSSKAISYYFENTRKKGKKGQNLIF